MAWNSGEIWLWWVSVVQLDFSRSYFREQKGENSYHLLFCLLCFFSVMKVDFLSQQVWRQRSGSDFFSSKAGRTWECWGREWKFLQCTAWQAVPQRNNTTKCQRCVVILVTKVIKLERDYKLTFLFHVIVCIYIYLQSAIM